MLNTEKTQEMAALKAGMDVKTARKYVRAKGLPSELKTSRHWRTHKAEFSDVWPEIQELQKPVGCPACATMWTGTKAACVDGQCAAR